MKQFVVVAHLPLEGAPEGTLPAEWMKGSKAQCEGKARSWRDLYRHVEVDELVFKAA